MYTNLVFFGYIGAVFLSLVSLCIVLVSAILRRKSAREAELPWFLAFTLTAFAYSLLYFIFYYRETVFQVRWMSIPWRLLDYALSGAQPALWMILLWRLNERENHRSLRVVAAIPGTYILCSLIVTAFFMDQYYYVASPVVRHVFLCLELCFTMGISALLLWSCRRCKGLSTQRSGVWVYIVSIALASLGILQYFSTRALYKGQTDGSLWQIQQADPTGPLLIAANLSILIFLLQTDYSPIYLVKERPVAPEPSPAEAPADLAALLDAAAEAHGLTAREREILELVYDGLSNPDIAQVLSITVNTVKGHIRNIFEKLGVSSRVELVHCINAQERTPKF